MKKLKLSISILIIGGIFLSGCAANVKDDWDTSTTFMYNKMTLHGVPEKFGMIKVNEKVMNLNF